VVEDGDADDRVELAAFEPLAGLDVPDDHVGPVADALPAPLDARLADVDGGELAARLDEAPCELARAAAELEGMHAGRESRGLGEKGGAPCGADLPRVARPSPRLLEVARGEALSLTTLGCVAVAAHHGSVTPGPLMISATRPAAGAIV
jgi:hypothetical protein